VTTNGDVAAGTRGLRAVVGAALAVATVSILLATPVAAATTVSTEAELRAAFADGGTTAITLANSIDLTDCSAGGGDLDRNGTLTLDGSGSILRQTCPGQRVIESTAGPLTLQHITITGGDQLGPQLALGGGVRATGDVTLDDVAVTGNRVTAGDVLAAGGGVATDGVITIISSHIDHNTVVAYQGWGGGIYGARLQPISISDSTVDGNTMSCSHEGLGLSYCSGGGVADNITSALVVGDEVASAASGGTVTLVRSSVSDNALTSTGDLRSQNQAYAVGGGINADAVDATDSHIDGNALSAEAGFTTDVLGGGLASLDVTLLRSTVDGNSGTSSGLTFSAASGSGVIADSAIVANQSSISGNHLAGVTGEGGARGGGVATSSAQLDSATVSGNVVEGTTTAYVAGISTNDLAMRGTTVADNTARATADGGVAYGGGLLVQGGHIDASTISGNTAAAPGYAHAGGLLHHVALHFGEPVPTDPNLTLTNSTVAANVAAAVEQDSVAGGLEETGAWSTSFVFSTVSGNSANMGANLATRPGFPNEPTGGTVALTSSVVANPLDGGYNCDGVTLSDSTFAHVTDASCGITASTDPQFGPLADNGGPTRTMLPAATSPLLDQVTAPECLAHVIVDQRGITRPQGPACDIGAVELALAAPSPPVTPVVPTAPPGPTAAPAVVAEPKFTG
jgi:hypothetical protein